MPMCAVSATIYTVARSGLCGWLQSMLTAVIDHMSAMSIWHASTHDKAMDFMAILIELTAASSNVYVDRLV